jgi:SP family general alpha glucoside:H+ symporter-like MFS transporter
MIGSLGVLNFFILIVFLANDVKVLLGGQILCGLCWGVFATLAPAYASEVSPTNLRGYMTTYVNLCWAIGQLLASGVLRGCLSIEGEWGYRIPFAVQWVCDSSVDFTATSLTRACETDLAYSLDGNMLPVA